MRKLLILLMLLAPLPALADATTDALGGPSTTSNTAQTTSPQQQDTQGSALQSAPSTASGQADGSTLQILQGSTPTSADKLLVEGDGAPQSLSATGTSNWLQLSAIGLVSILILIGAGWWWWQLGHQTQP